MRAARWTVLAGAAGTAAWAAFTPRPVPASELLAAAEDACAASRFEDAAAICGRLTSEHPDDAAGWLLLARSLRGAGRPPEAFIPAAERAIAADARDAAAHTFLARAEAARGRLAAAIAHATSATSLAPEDGEAWLLVADLEMKRPRPDLARVRDALERAQAQGAESRDAQILLADVSIRLNGAVGTGAERLSTTTAAALRRALAALDANRAAEKDLLAAGLVRARFLLALGQPEEAFAAAEAALARVPQDTPPAATADVRLLRAMALHSRGNRAEAMRAFADVLRDRPDAPTAAAASAYLVASDEPAASRELLVGAAPLDKSGGIHAVLASTLLEAHDLDGASQAIAAACTASPADPFFAEIRGSIREAEGRLANARAAYADAVRLGDALVGPRVRLALLVLAETPPDAAKPGAYDAAVAELSGLRDRFDDDPQLLVGLGRLQLARGDVFAARDVLEAAAARRPSDADVWLALAEARGRSGDTARLDRAAEALGQARRLRPGDATVTVREARAWIDAGKPDVAAAACAEHLRRRPADALVLRQRAAAYRRLSMWNLEADDLRRVRELGAGGRDDDAALVVALARSGDAAGANRVVEETRAADASGAARLLGHVGALAGRDAGAVAKALAGPEPSPLLACLQFEAGRRSDALDGLRVLLRDRPGDPLLTRLVVVMLLAPDAPLPSDLAEARTAAAALPASAPASVRDLVEGRLLLAESNAAEAATRLRAADAALEGDPVAAVLLGDAILHTGETDLGLASLRRAAALPGADPWVATVAARRFLSVSLATGDPAQAAPLALEAFRLDPALVAAAFRASSLLHARGDFGRAADVAEGALSAASPAPDDVLRLRLIAVTDRRLDGEPAAARAHADALPPAARDSAPARLLRGYAELEAGRLDDAERLFAAAFAADPADGVAVSGLVRTALRRGDLDAALARISQWTSAHADDRDVALAACDELLRQGRPESAMPLASACAARRPHDVAVARLCARASLCAGDVATAVRTLRSFADAAPPADALDVRLEAVPLAGAHGLDADAALAEARRAGDDSAPWSRALGRASEAEILLATGKPHDAENAARAAIAAVERMPGRGRPERRVEARARRVLGLAAASAVSPRRADAIDELSRSAALDPANLDAADDLARLLAASADSAPRAVDVAQPLTVAEPGNARRWDTLADACRAAGRQEDARAAWTRALDLLASARPADPARRGRVALRFARFLRECDDAAAARRVAQEARTAAAGTDVEPELARFLAE